MLLRGAIPSPRHRLAAALPHVVSTPTPSQFLWKPKQISIWGNDQFGDCTVAEEAFAKSATAGVFIPDAEVIQWARTNGAINGDTLIDVLDKMETGGFALNGKNYDDGSPVSVDWTNQSNLQNAISQGPVKIGVAADQLQTAYGVTNPDLTFPAKGWFATGFTQDFNMDHCVSLCGYGPISWLAEELDVSIPSGTDTNLAYFALFTWDSIGIIDLTSLVNITGEAWLRNPTTVIR
jgi:hypothetical protein